MFALWISQLFADSAPFKLTKTHGRDKDGLRNFAVTTRAPCARCNSTWMSQIESTAMKPLAQIVLGESVSWDRPTQKSIAAWSFKTALMLDRSSLAGHRAPHEHFEYLWRIREAPPSSRVFLARYFPSEGEEAFGVSASVGDGSPKVAGSYRISFSVGNAVFLIYGYAGVEDIGIEINSWANLASGLLLPLGSIFTRIWPVANDPYRWPPEGGVLNTHSLETLGNRPLMA